jgi:hypothetical protein
VSLDRRLREELSRDAESIVTDVERSLDTVEAGARRRPSVGSPALLAVAVVVAVALAVRLGASSPSAPGGPGASPANAASATPAYDDIAGTYAVTLDPADATVARDGVGGTWTMRLLDDGEVFLSPPATFGEGSSPLSGVAFSLVADRFRTNLFYNTFCSSIGTYTWVLQGGRLSFTPVDETCSVRRTLLSTAPWQASP